MSELYKSIIIKNKVNNFYKQGCDFISACRDGQLNVIKNMLKSDSNFVHLKDTSGNTGLIYATIYENEAVIKVLKDAGANINHKNNYGKSAIMYAVEKGNVNLTNKLLGS